MQTMHDMKSLRLDAQLMASECFLFQVWKLVSRGMSVPKGAVRGGRWKCEILGSVTNLDRY